MDTHLNGYRISYQDNARPNAPVIVFLHGFPFNQTMWNEQVALLQADYRVITYDHRGHGNSEVGDGQYLIDLLVDDLIGLLDHLKVTKAILCGLSMGGYTALRAIERYPDRISGLILCDTRSEADGNEAKAKRADGVRTVKAKGVSVFAEGFLKALFPPESFEKRPQVIERVRQMINGNSALSVAGTLIALASRTDTTAALANVKVPTLILVGEKDAITPPSAAEALHKNIAGSRLEVIPEAGHMSNVENPAVFNRALATFLKTLR